MVEACDGVSDGWWGCVKLPGLVLGLKLDREVDDARRTMNDRTPRREIKLAGSRYRHVVPIRRSSDVGQDRLVGFRPDRLPVTRDTLRRGHIFRPGSARGGRGLN